MRTTAVLVGLALAVAALGAADVGATRVAPLATSTLGSRLRTVRLTESASRGPEDENLRPRFHYGDTVTLKAPQPLGNYLYAGDNSCNEPRATGSQVVDQMMWELINPGQPDSKKRLETGGQVALRSSQFSRYLLAAGGCSDSDTVGIGMTFLWDAEKSASVQDVKNGHGFVTFQADDNPGNKPEIPDEDKRYLGVDSATANAKLTATPTAWTVDVVKKGEGWENAPECPPCFLDVKGAAGENEPVQHSYRFKYGDVVVVNQANEENECRWWYDNNCGSAISATSATVGEGEKFTLVNPDTASEKGGLVSNTGKVAFSPVRYSGKYLYDSDGTCAGSLGAGEIFNWESKWNQPNSTGSSWYDSVTLKAREGKFLSKDSQGKVTAGTKEGTWKVFLVKSWDDRCSCTAKTSFANACEVKDV